jgi:putative addiction module antidote
MTAIEVVNQGSGATIVLPPEVLQKLKVGSGDKVCFVDTPSGIELKRVDGELAEQLQAIEQVMDEDDDALRQLAK